MRWIEFRQKKWHFFVTGPGPCQIKMTSVDFILSREEQWLCILGDLGAVSQLKNFHPAFSPDPTDCPWVSEDIDGGYAIKAKKKKNKKKTVAAEPTPNTEEYITGKSFLFISIHF